MKLRHVFAGLAMVGALLIIAGCGSKNGDGSKTSNLLTVPADATKFEDKNYKDVVSQLKNAKFKNITLVKDADLIVSILQKEGDVESVTINGKDDFEKGDQFKPTAKVKVTYHTQAVDSSSSSSDDDSSSSTSSSSADSSSSASSSSAADKASYTLTSRREKGEIFITGSISLIGHNGEETSVKVGDGGIKPGTYKASWTPGVLHGSDPDTAYGFVYANDDEGNGYQLTPGESETLTFKAGDTLTFKFFGQGDSDRIRLEEQ